MLRGLGATYRSDSELSLLTVRGGRQSHHAKHARAHPLCDGLDGPTLPGGVATFEQDDDPRSRLLDPALQVAKLDLELAQFLLVSLALHLLLGFAACRPFQCHDLTPLLQPALRTLSCAALFRYRGTRRRRATEQRPLLAGNLFVVAGHLHLEATHKSPSNVRFQAKRTLSRHSRIDRV